MNIATSEHFLNKDTLKVLTLFGSPHSYGATAMMRDLFVSEMKSFFITSNTALEFFDFNVFNEPIQPCTDCRACRKEFGCVFDDLNNYYRFLMEADIVLVATPVYGRSFPALLKAVFDRHQLFWSSKFIRGENLFSAHPKQVFLITVSGADNPDEGKAVAEQLSLQAKLFGGELEKCFHHFGTDYDKPLDEIQAEIRRFWSDIKH